MRRNIIINRKKNTNISMKLHKRILNILFWSVVSAAFIGPGTITTAAKSGASFGSGLLWALLFSTLACLLLQEAASRITILSGRNLGEALKEKWQNSLLGWPLVILIALAIGGGAAAYEMGNLIGAKEGMTLLFPGMKTLIIPVLGLSAAIILFIPSLKTVARIMGVLVMILGFTFLYAAIKVAPPFSEIWQGLLIPRMPSGSEAPWLVLALIGTTIVPYNLFLGSGISSTKNSLKEMRWGLTFAILLGGLFSMSVVVVGSALKGDFSFQSLAAALSSHTGVEGKYLLGIGLFAAGFTSAITAPLATAITLKSLFGKKESPGWQSNGLYFRISWFLVLAIGMFFAILNLKPIPAIILAQALNGLILPLVSFLLVWLIHDKDLTGRRNPLANSILLGTTLVITLVIGLNNLMLSIGKILNFNIDNPSLVLKIFVAASLVITGLFFFKILKRR